MPTGTQTQINDFLAQKRIAMVGLSRNKSDFSRTLFADMKKFGYDVVGVNAKATEIDGLKCYASLKEVEARPDAALVILPKEAGPAVVEECAALGIQRVWLYGPGSDGQVNPEAVMLAQAKGLTVIAGHCPYMFLKQAPFFHGFHRFFLKLSGAYPR
jgi:uncharacterized protein